MQVRASLTALAILASKQQMDAERKTFGAAALKQTTGKSLKESQNMSDAERDALSKDLERKYGK